MTPKPGDGTGTPRERVENISKVTETTVQHQWFAVRPFWFICRIAQAGSARGPNRITLMPTRQIAAPMTSQWSGRLPSIAQPHSSALAM